METDGAPRLVPGLAGDLCHVGKVRETYDIGDGKLLVVASDRISTHNLVHKNTVPLKGAVLTALTVFWLEDVLKEVLERTGMRSHIVAYGTEVYDHLPPPRESYAFDLHHRAIVVQKCTMIPVEFVVRGRLAGSLYAERRENPYGFEIPSGMRLMEPFAYPVLTPTEKSDTDDPLLTIEVKADYPSESDASCVVFDLIQRYLNKRGIEIVDTKLEWGFGGVLADEVATPDSSRFCDLDAVQIGKPPVWLDKQSVRDWAEAQWGEKEKAPLELPKSILSKLSNTYCSVFERIVGISLTEFQRNRLNV